jgi:hypothetical protein
LPDGCSWVKTEQGVAIALCRPAPETAWGKFWPSLPGLLLSCFAAGLAVYSFLYAKQKDVAARDQSIRDDFWLRKVVSPASIEPFIKFSAELTTSLPDASTAPAEVREYWLKQVERTNEFASIFALLTLVKDDMHTGVNQQLEFLDDVVSSYCGNLQAHLEQGKPEPSRKEAVARIRAISIALLKAIQTHQLMSPKKA